jgi:predicted CXXCH cytochrome family protein
MKKSILLAAAFGLILAGTAQAQDSTTGSFNAPAGTGIVGSKHDLSIATGIGALYGQTDALDRICIYCHAPHHTLQQADAAGINYLPLWNHGVTTQFYNTYQSDFGDGPDASGLAGVGVTSDTAQFADRHLFNGEATIGEPGSVSRLCLSCHDGTVAVNEYGFDPQRAVSQGAGTHFIADQFKIGGGGNLTNHHPIGFDYNDVVQHDDEIADPSTVINGAGAGAKEMTTIGSLLYNGRMECVTCHDVHNTKNTGETFLWKSDRESGFCLTCHIK